MNVLIGAAVGLFILVLISVLTEKKGRRKKPITRSVEPVASQRHVAASPLIRSEIFRGFEQTKLDEAFEKIIEDAYGQIIDKHFYSKVAGITFANEDGVKREDIAGHCKTFDLVNLVREPENPYGSTAIAVKSAGDQKLGYLPHQVAEQLSWDIDRYHREWLAVVRHMYDHQVDGHSAMVLFLMRVKLPETESDRFESQFKKTVDDRYDTHFHALMDRAFGLNEDGSDRQQLIAECKPFQRVSLHREPQNKHDMNSVSVVTEGGQRIGYLARRIAAEVAPQMDAGRCWAAVVQRIEPTATGRRLNPHLCIYRLAV